MYRVCPAMPDDIPGEPYPVGRMAAGCVDEVVKSVSISVITTL